MRSIYFKSILQIKKRNSINVHTQIKVDFCPTQYVVFMCSIDRKFLPDHFFQMIILWDMIFLSSNYFLEFLLNELTRVDWSKGTESLTGGVQGQVNVRVDKDLSTDSSESLTSGVSGHVGCHAGKTKSICRWGPRGWRHHRRVTSEPRRATALPFYCIPARTSYTVRTTRTRRT